MTGSAPGSPGDAERVRLVAQRYDEMADAYVRHWGPLLASLSRPITQRIAQLRPSRIADVACGTGTLLPAWSAASALPPVGFDIAVEPLRRCPAGSPVVTADVNALPVRDDSFDVAAIVFALQHVLDPRVALREMLRVAPVVASVTWGARGTWLAEQAWTATLDEHGAPPVALAIANHHLVDDELKMREALTAAGARHTETWTVVAEQRWDLDAMWACLTDYGSPARRWRSLPPPARASALTAGRAAVAALGAEATVWSPPIVFAIGRR